MLFGFKKIDRLLRFSWNLYSVIAGMWNYKPGVFCRKQICMETFCVTSGAQLLCSATANLRFSRNYYQKESGILLAGKILYSGSFPKVIWFAWYKGKGVPEKKLCLMLLPPLLIPFSSKAKNSYFFNKNLKEKLLTEPEASFWPNLSAWKFLSFSIWFTFYITFAKEVEKRKKVTFLVCFKLFFFRFLNKFVQLFLFFLFSAFSFSVLFLFSF